MKLNDRKESSMKYIPKTEHIIQPVGNSDKFTVLIVSNSVQLEIMPKNKLKIDFSHILFKIRIDFQDTFFYLYFAICFYYNIFINSKGEKDAKSQCKRHRNRCHKI